MTPLERAVRSLHPHLVSAKGLSLSKADREAMAKAPQMVKSILLALRGPSEVMLDFGAEADDSASRENASSVWTAMIDAALAEE